MQRLLHRALLFILPAVKLPGLDGMGNHHNGNDTRGEILTSYIPRVAAVGR